MIPFSSSLHGHDCPASKLVSELDQLSQAPSRDALGKTKTQIFWTRKQAGFGIIRRKNVEEQTHTMRSSSHKKTRKRHSKSKAQVRGIGYQTTHQRKSGQKLKGLIWKNHSFFPISSSPMLDRVFLLGWLWMHSILQLDAIEKI